MLPHLCLSALALASIPSAPEDDEAPGPRGLVANTGAASPGFTLIAPFSSGTTYLVDLEGRVVHTWESRYEPGLYPYLLPNGNLLRGIQLEVPSRFRGGGQAGGVQELSWDGELVWEYHLANDRVFHHHDIEPLPNGNVLMIVWEKKTREEAVAVGRHPDHVGEEGIWPGAVLEIEPLRPFGARVVWEWHTWDHLVQDYDSALPNHDLVVDRPDRVDINADTALPMTADERRQLEALGYLDADAKADGEAGDEEGEDDAEEKKKQAQRPDWLHINGIDYNAALDQIAVSLNHFSEIWIIDHGTTTEEAAGSTGGRRGKGGDLLYRWGNPQRYKAGDEQSQQLFHQHDVQWIPEGSPGAGNLTIFDNGREREEKEYSSAVEITPPLLADGTYAHEEGEAFGPEEPVWRYDAPEEEQFYASFISGCERLANGNTLMCSGPDGRAIEVNPQHEIVWEYRSPFAGEPSSREIDDKEYSMFRAARLPPDHPGLRGHSLEPLDPQPKTTIELAAELPERPERTSSGWQPLFDEELRRSKWRDVNCDDETFSVQPDPEDEDPWILHCTGKPTGILHSDRMYENFIVEFEWRHMEDPSNAGFFVWADSLPAIGGPFTRGIEVQVCNLGNSDWFTSHGDIFPIWGSVMTPDPRFRISGSRSMPREEDFHGNPTGEWNHYRITAIDGAIQLEVNGHLVTAGTGCDPKKGYLCIESEGGEVHFRDMRIWELPPGSNPAGVEQTCREAEPWSSLYNGLDLEDWEIESGEWTSDDWRFTCTAAEANIRRALPEGSRAAFFDFKRSAPAGSPLPLRIGDARVPATGEEPEAWNRVHLQLDGGTLVLEFAGHRHELNIESFDALTLCNDGIATEFCSAFSLAED